MRSNSNTSSETLDDKDGRLLRGRPLCCSLRLMRSLVSTPADGEMRLSVAWACGLSMSLSVTNGSVKGMSLVVGLPVSAL